MRPTDAGSETVRWRTPAARRVLVTCVLGSSMAFLDSTVVNVALPTIGRELDTGLAGLQWVLDAYLVTLTAFVLLGGLLGDRFGHRRVFILGVGGFAVASVVCGIAPNAPALIAARGLQGAAAALLVPGSLVLLTESIHPDDRSRAVGAWSGLSGVAGAVGPFLGGWLVDAQSWRLVFLINVPVAVVVLAVARKVPEHRRVGDHGRSLDGRGAALAALGLAALTAGVISRGSTWSLPAIFGALVLLGAFVLVERRAANPMLPMSLFSSRQFAGANAVTLAVYAALGATMFLVVVYLQRALGYAPIEAGAALAPITLLLLLLSAGVGAATQRFGPTVFMTAGPVVSALGLGVLSRVHPGSSYVASVLPATVLVGLGLAFTVAPLTAVVLAAVDDDDLGVAAGVNNAVARLAGLLGIAVLPTVADFHEAMVIGAVLSAVGGLIAAATVRRARPVEPTMHASYAQPCHDPCRQSEAA